MYQVMLCKLGNKNDLNKKNYIAEPKLDGTRILLIKKGRKNTNYQQKTEKYSLSLS